MLGDSGLVAKLASVTTNNATILNRVPKDIWRKIYEYILLDIELENKGNFNLACKYFNDITNDPDHIKNIIQHYFPIYLDSPEYETQPSSLRPAIRYLLGFNLRPFDLITFVGRYSTAQVVAGMSLKNLASNLTNRLLRLANGVINRKEMESTLNEFFENDNDKDTPSYVQFGMQRDFPVSRILTLSFSRGLQSALEFRNFRALLALLDPTQLTHKGIRGLQWAALCRDIEKLKKLMTQKEEAFTTEQPIDADDDVHTPLLISLKEHLNSENIYEIKECLQIKNISDDTIESLNDEEFCYRISNWRFDDIFKEMTIETFGELQKFAGISYFQAAMVPPLVATCRTDLLKLCQLPQLSAALDGRDIALCALLASYFLWAYYRVTQEPAEAQREIRTETYQAMLANKTIQNILVRDIRVIAWACKHAEIDLINLGLATFSLSIDNDETKECIKEILTWVFANNRKDCIILIMQKAFQSFIPYLVLETHSRQYPDIFMSALKEISFDQREKFVLELLLLALSEGDVARAEHLIKHYVLTEHEATNIALALYKRNDLGKTIINPLLALVASARFDLYAIGENYGALFVDIAKQANLAYLDHFLSRHIRATPKSHLFEFIQAIQARNEAALWQKMMHCALECDLFKGLGRVHNRPFLEVLARDKTVQATIHDNPQLIVELLTDTYESEPAFYTHHTSVVLSLFALGLTRHVKFQLLRMAFQQLSNRDWLLFKAQLLQQFPDDFTYYHLRDHFGLEDPLLHIVPQPSLLSRTAHYIGTTAAAYLPSFGRLRQTPRAADDEHGLKRKSGDSEAATKRPRLNQSSNPSDSE